MDGNQILKLLLAEVSDLRQGYAQRPAKVEAVLDEAMEIQIRRDRVELCLGVECRRHGYDSGRRGDDGGVDRRVKRRLEEADSVVRDAGLQPAEY